MLMRLYALIYVNRACVAPPASVYTFIQCLCILILFIPALCDITFWCWTCKPSPRSIPTLHTYKSLIRHYACLSVVMFDYALLYISYACL